MSKPQDNKPSIFQKFIEAGSAVLDAQILKAKTTIINSDIDEDFFFGKAIGEDPTYSLHSQGWKDKPFRIQNSHLKQMSTGNSIIAAVIQTRQNQVGAHSKLVKSNSEKGWKLELRDEDALLEKIKEELKASIAMSPDAPGEDDVADNTFSEENLSLDKADSNPDDTSLEGIENKDTEDDGMSDDNVEASNWELERKAREKLNKQFEKAKKAAEDYILNCGKTENRTFETKKWNFDTALRALARDSLTYDLMATETVPDKAGRPHHWFPVDGGTIKYASPSLKNYKDLSEDFINIDILYPEKEPVPKDLMEAIKLDPVLLEKDAYKYVQVIRGKVERGYTEDEMKVGIRNLSTDIYINGYGLSELELLVGMVTGHLNAEYYNQAYFTQGFSAKGILHIKAALNRRKVETVRTQWQHMVRGARNSFQTPIFAGVEDVKWIPLTQNHNDIGFEGWMRYLVTIMASIYQIDPTEMGIYFKAEGPKGSNLASDNTEEKINSSKDRGLYPLMRFFENFISEQILKPFDARFVLRFTGISGEDHKNVVDRQEREVKFKKTVNEIRMEDGLPPLPGMDEIILDAQYMAYWTQFSDKAIEKSKTDQANAMKQQAAAQPPAQEEDSNAVDPETDIYGDHGSNIATSAENPLNQEVTKSLNSKKFKKLSVEVYKIEK